MQVNTTFAKNRLFTRSEVRERQVLDGQKRRRSAREWREISRPVQREAAWNVVHFVSGTHERFDTNLSFKKLTSDTSDGSAVCISASQIHQPLVYVEDVNI